MWEAVGQDITGIVNGVEIEFIVVGNDKIVTAHPYWDRNWEHK